VSVEPGRDDEAGPQPGCAYVRRDLAAAIIELRELMADVTADRDRPDLTRRAGRLTARLAEVQAAVDAHLWNDRLAEVFAGIPLKPGPDRPGTVVPLRRRREPRVAGLLGAAKGLHRRRAAGAGVVVLFALTGHTAPAHVPAPVRVAPAAAQQFRTGPARP